VAAENATKLKLLIYIELHLFINTFTVLGKPLSAESGGRCPLSQSPSLLTIGYVFLADTGPEC
jgi:hypothetical protein